MSKKNFVIQSKVNIFHQIQPIHISSVSTLPSHQARVFIYLLYLLYLTNRYVSSCIYCVCTLRARFYIINIIYFIMYVIRHVSTVSTVCHVTRHVSPSVFLAIRCSAAVFRNSYSNLYPGSRQSRPQSTTRHTTCHQSTQKDNDKYSFL